MVRFFLDDIVALFLFMTIFTNCIDSEWHLFYLFRLGYFYFLSLYSFLNDYPIYKSLIIVLFTIFNDFYLFIFFSGKLLVSIW